MLSYERLWANSPVANDPVSVVLSPDRVHGVATIFQERVECFLRPCWVYAIRCFEIMVDGVTWEEHQQHYLRDVLMAVQGLGLHMNLQKGMITAPEVQVPLAI